MAEILSDNWHLYPPPPHPHPDPPLMDEELTKVYLWPLVLQ